jgi:hypothetical protein
LNGLVDHRLRAQTADQLNVSGDVNDWHVPDRIPNASDRVNTCTLVDTIVGRHKVGTMGISGSDGAGGLSTKSKVS